MSTLSIRGVHKKYKAPGGFAKNKYIDVLRNINLEISSGSCAGLVGESGSGKSTLSRLVLGLENPDSGTILMEDKTLPQWKKTNPQGMSVVFQDYTASMNPRWTVRKIIEEPLKASGAAKNMGAENIRKKIITLLKRVELPEILLDRYPYQLSGGQLQRVSIARTIAAEPEFIVLDEPLSSLDVSVQASVLDLLIELRKETKSTFLFITHDIQTVVSFCDVLYFLQRGSIVEQCETHNIASIQNEYARKLVFSPISFHNQETRKIKNEI